MFLCSKSSVQPWNHLLQDVKTSRGLHKRRWLCSDVGLTRHRQKRCVRMMSGGDLGRYQYSRTEIDELAAMMPARLDAPVQARSRKVLKEVLEKHGLKVNSLVDDEVSDDVPEVMPLLPELTEWLDSDPEWNKGINDEVAEKEGWANVKEPLGLPFPDPDDDEKLQFWIENIENCFEEQQNWELEQLFKKALDLHFAQTKRANNIYSATLWYGEVMRQIEIWDDYEGGSPVRIPSYLRAIFLLEENFDKLNAGQHISDSKLDKLATKKEKALFYSWVEENLDITLNVSDEPEHKHQEELESSNASSLSIDELLHGTIPNAEGEGEDDEVYDDVVKDLLEGGSGEINFQVKEDPASAVSIPPLKGMEDINY